MELKILLIVLCATLAKASPQDNMEFTDISQLLSSLGIKDFTIERANDEPKKDVVPSAEKRGIAASPAVYELISLSEGRDVQTETNKNQLPAAPVSYNNIPNPNALQTQSVMTNNMEMNNQIFNNMYSKSQDISQQPSGQTQQGSENSGQYNQSYGQSLSPLQDKPWSYDDRPPPSRQDSWNHPPPSRDYWYRRPPYPPPDEHWHHRPPPPPPGDHWHRHGPPPPPPEHWNHRRPPPPPDRDPWGYHRPPPHDRSPWDRDYHHGPPPPYHRGPPPDHYGRGPPRDYRRPHGYPRGPPPDYHRGPPDHRGPPPPGQPDGPPDHRRPPPDHHRPPTDPRGPLPPEDLIDQRSKPDSSSNLDAEFIDNNFGNKVDRAIPYKNDDLGNESYKDLGNTDKTFYFQFVPVTPAE